MQANETIEIIHQVLGNTVRTYILQDACVDGADPWMGILEASDFPLRFTYNCVKERIPGQLVFGQDTTLPIVHVVN